MKNIMIKKILGGLVICATLLIPTVAFASGSPHTSYGIVTSGDTSSYFKAYVPTRPTEILSGTLSLIGSSYIWTTNIGNLSTGWSNGDDSIAIISKEVSAGTTSHQGYYAVINETLSSTTNPQPYNTCTLRALPTPTAAASTTTGNVVISWTAISANPDTSATPNAGNVIGYNVYRSTDGITFTKANSSIVTNPGSGTVTYSDTSGTDGTTYYYAIEPVFIGSVALCVKSSNSNTAIDPVSPVATLTIATVSLSNGTVGTYYSQTLSATGGSGTYAWSRTAGSFPTGMTISSLGVIYGTPTVAGTYSVTIQVSDGSTTSSQVLSIIINPAAPSITSSSWPTGASYGYVFDQLTINGSGFTGSGSSPAPTGCTVEVKFQGGSYTNLSDTSWMSWWEDGKVQIVIPNNNGSIYAVAGTGTVRISNANGTTSETFTIKPKVYTVSPMSGPVGTSVKISGTAFSDTAASNGVTFNSTSASTGTISRSTNLDTIEVTVPSSTPTGVGQVLVTVNSNSSNTNYDWGALGQVSFEVTAATTALNITTTSLTAGIIGTAYSKTLVATGGTGTYTWSTTGTLPPGLSINASTGKISGTPTTAGTYSFNAVVSDGTSTDTQALSITISATAVPILDLSTNTLTYTATAAAINPANQSFNITNEGTASMLYTASESLSWLSINRSGGTLSAGASTRETVSVNISGLVAGTYTGKVTVESTGGTEEVAITLTVTASTPATTAPEISGLSSSSAYIGQTITISGSGFGTSGTVTIGGVATSPTSWTDGSITLAVPAGVSAGSKTLSITTSGGTDTYSIAIASGSIYIDDYEGGCVGTWSAPDTTSGYYVYGSGITPSTDSTLSTQGPTLEAKYEGSRGMKVKYSYSSTGVGYGGWGAVLANNLNLSGMNNIKFYLKWDGTSNDYNLVLKDSDGTAVLAQLSSSGLSSSSFTQITVATSEFSYSSTSSDTGANTSFNWSQIAGYGLAYSMTNTTSSYQNFDSLLATYVDVATPYLSVNSTGVSFSTYVGGTTTSPTSNTVTISNSSAGSSSMAYTATCATSWVTLSGASGTLAGGASTTLAVSVNLANAPTAAGTYYATIEVASATAQNSPQSIMVTLTVRELSGSNPTITDISQSSAPAGTRIILTGSNFGSSQGASTISFTKDGAATVAKTISWADGAIEVEVPYTLSEGNYDVAVYKLIIADSINVLSQSDAVSFQVTAASTAGIATIWPNPFNPRVETITIQFDAGTATNIGVSIYDSTARVVKHSLVTGVNQVTWDGKNSAGEIVGDGLYLVRITNEESKALIAKGKILVVKR